MIKSSVCKGTHARHEYYVYIDFNIRQNMPMTVKLKTCSSYGSGIEDICSLVGLAPDLLFTFLREVHKIDKIRRLGGADYTP